LSEVFTPCCQHSCPEKSGLNLCTVRTPVRAHLLESRSDSALDRSGYFGKTVVTGDLTEFAGQPPRPSASTSSGASSTSSPTQSSRLLQLSRARCHQLISGQSFILSRCSATRQLVQWLQLRLALLPGHRCPHLRKYSSSRPRTRRSDSVNSD
jgi:hypothetical protein